MTRRLCETSIKCDEGERLAHLALEIEATRELHGVPGTQAVAEQQGARVRRNFWGELDNDQRGQIVGE
jgi:hypothetical protein